MFQVVLWSLLYVLLCFAFSSFLPKRNLSSFEQSFHSCSLETKYFYFILIVGFCFCVQNSCYFHCFYSFTALFNIVLSTCCFLQFMCNMHKQWLHMYSVWICMLYTLNTFIFILLKHFVSFSYIIWWLHTVTCCWLHCIHLSCCQIHTHTIKSDVLKHFIHSFIWCRKTSYKNPGRHK